MTSNSHYSKLYDDIASNRGLLPSARILLTIIISLARTSGRCYASNAALAKRAGLRTSQTRAQLAVLEEKGFIAREINPGRRRDGIQVLWEAPVQVHPDDDGASSKVTAERHLEDDGGASSKMTAGRAKMTAGRRLHKNRLLTEASLAAKAARAKPIRTDAGGGSPERPSVAAPAPGTDGGEQSPDDERFDFAALRARFGAAHAASNGTERSGDLRKLFGALPIPGVDPMPADDPVIRRELDSRPPRQNPLPDEQNPP
jgi:hypothetical protein